MRVTGGGGGKGEERDEGGVRERPGRRERAASQSRAVEGDSAKVLPAPMAICRWAKRRRVKRERERERTIEKDSRPRIIYRER